jgi:hypothetical protein
MESTPTTRASSDECTDQEGPEVRFHLFKWGATRGNSGEKFYVGIKPETPIITRNIEEFLMLLDQCVIIK